MQVAVRRGKGKRKRRKKVKFYMKFVCVLIASCFVWYPSVNTIKIHLHSYLCEQSKAEMKESEAEVGVRGVTGEDGVSCERVE